MKLIRVIVIFLFFFNAFIFFKSFVKKNIFENTSKINHNIKDKIFLNKLSKLHFFNLNNKDVDINKLVFDNNKKLIIIFSLHDCPGCLKEIKLWNKIFINLKLKIYALVPHKNIKEVKIFVYNENIKFPVFINKTEKLYDLLDFSETPIKLLLDEKSNIVSLTIPFLNKNLEKKYYQYVQTFIKN